MCLFLEESCWLEGPQFLWLPKQSWPQQPTGMDRKVEENDPEVKKEVKTCATRADMATNSQDRIFEQISSWYHETGRGTINDPTAWKQTHPFQC